MTDPSPPSRFPAITGPAALLFAAATFAAGWLLAASTLPEATGGGAAGEDSAAPPVLWRVPVAFGTNLPALGDNILFVRDQVAAATGGRIQLQVFEPGKLVPTLDIVPAVRDGKIPAGYTWLGYDQGWLPAAPLISAVPFGMAPWAFPSWWFEDGGKDLAEELYRPHGIVPVLCGLIGPETAGWFRTPVDDPEDFAGLKIRFAGLGGRVLQEMGASVTMIPGSELFQALEKGTIDATEYSMPSIDEKLGFDRVAKHNYFPGWHQTFSAFHLVVNADVWDSIGAENRAAIETACMAGAMRNFARGEAIQGAALEALQARGVHTERLGRDLLLALQAQTDVVLAREAEGNPMFARILESQRAFMTRYAAWRGLAYLPPGFGEDSDEEGGAP